LPQGEKKKVQSRICASDNLIQAGIVAVWETTLAEVGMGQGLFRMVWDRTKLASPPKGASDGKGTESNLTTVKTISANALRPGLKYGGYRGGEKSGGGVKKINKGGKNNHKFSASAELGRGHHKRG